MRDGSALLARRPVVAARARGLRPPRPGGLGAAPRSCGYLRQSNGLGHSSGPAVMSTRYITALLSPDRAPGVLNVGNRWPERGQQLAELRDVGSAEANGVVRAQPGRQQLGATVEQPGQPPSPRPRPPAQQAQRGLLRAPQGDIRRHDTVAGHQGLSGRKGCSTLPLLPGAPPAATHPASGSTRGHKP